ncbi:UvrD-helicase domain-containing protein [Ensifer aridi]|uniref:UvrD-helicase domain-containing protein n=1 Tax=Ensifer aridi TaxID=1708715 RepID=UPI00358FE55D
MTIAAIASNVAVDDPVDEEIAGYLDIAAPRSFFLFAGAGSGKTRSLAKALNHIRERHGRALALRGQRVGVITYTNAACDEINRRVEFHPLFYVSTIHSFAWELIRGFHNDIREWLRDDLTKDIEQLKQEEAKGRQGTKASIARQSRIASKTKRLDRLDTIRSFAYNPSGENGEPNSLNHSEVIAICSTFIAEKPLMRWILTGRFPFLLIDESQDTNKHLIDALFVVAKEHEGRFGLGLIGDVMQRIYADGKERIEAELPPSWGKPSKKLNHRCPKRVVRLINKVRQPVDTHLQEARSDALDGHVRMFIRPTVATGQQETEDAIRLQMAKLTEDEQWQDRDACKILTLEHHMAARRLGFDTLFAPLYEIDGWRTGLLDGTLPSVRFFTQVILPLVNAQQSGDKFTVAHIMRSESPLLAPQALKNAQDPVQQLRQTQSAVDALMQLWDDGEPTCEVVLRCVGEHNLFELPDALQPVWELLKCGNDDSSVADAEDPVAPEIAALLAAMKAPFREIDLYRRYVSGEASFDTHQGVKGLEFERVMVIINDAEARGFMFGYGKLLGEKAPTASDIKNKQEGRDSSIDRTRRLFYVTCSRAEKSLAVVVYAENPAVVKKHVVDSGWFHEEEIDAEY